MKRIIISTVIGLSLVSCDPLQIILFENKTDATANVLIKINTEFPNAEIVTMATGDSIMFSVNKDAVKTLDFGIGDWPDSEIEKVAKTIKSLEIETKNKSIIYKNPEQIKNLFKANRSGFLFKNKVTVEIE